MLVQNLNKDEKKTNDTKSDSDHVFQQALYLKAHLHLAVIFFSYLTMNWEHWSIEVQAKMEHLIEIHQSECQAESHGNSRKSVYFVTVSYDAMMAVLHLPICNVI